MSRSAGLVSINYAVGSGGEEAEISFHAIISESHEVTTEITKFPVQTGFEISNHAIRHNRKVVIEAIVTNTPLVGQVEYGTTNPSIYMFETLQVLVQSAIPCVLSTNLGFYEPVVFKKLTTKQAAGTMNSMQFTMTGEELQVQDSLNKTAPKKLDFTLVPDEEYQSYIDKLDCMGLKVQGTPEISTAELPEGDDFSVDTTTMAGVAGAATFLSLGTNVCTGITSYEVNTSDTDYLTPDGGSSFGMFSLSDDPDSLFNSIDLGKGASTAGTCLRDGVIDVGSGILDGFIDTQVGLLESTLYGAKQDIMQMGGSEAGQALMGVGLDCMVVGVASAFTDPIKPDPCNDETKSADLPTADDAIFGISEKVPKSQEIIKIAGGLFS
jgi:hypothetical protein